MVRDDEGRQRRVYPLLARAVADGSGGRRAAIALWLRAAGGPQAGAVLLIALAGVAAATLAAREGTRILGLAFHTPVVASVIVGIVGGGAALAEARARFARRVVAGLLAQCRCGSCGYGLQRPEGADPRALVRCPECGAAWRANRVRGRRGDGARTVLVVGRAPASRQPPGSDTSCES